MKFFTSDEHAKKVARHLAKELSEAGRDIAHTSILNIVAVMYGFANWAERSALSKGQPPSPFDRECPHEDVASRRQRHLVALTAIGLPTLASEKIVDRIRATEASAPESSSVDIVSNINVVGGLALDALKERRWREAEQFCIVGLQHPIDDASREALTTILKRTAEAFPAARVNLALAHAYGQARPASRIMAIRLLDELLQTSDLSEREEEIITLARSDIEMGRDGHGPRDADVALRLVKGIADKYGSADSCYRTAAAFQERKNWNEAAKYYRLGIAKGHAMSMMGLSQLIAMGVIGGNQKDVDSLTERAARLGLPLAIAMLDLAEEDDDDF